VVQHMKTILVTGATGFIGRHALEPLVQRGYRVHAVTSKPSPATQPGVVWHGVDLLNPMATSALMASVRPTRLLHFAWSVVPSSSASPVDNMRWVQATVDLVREFELFGGMRAVIAGSCAEYDWNQGQCAEDLTPLAPSSVYGASKNAARWRCEALTVKRYVSLAWGRIFFVYGPHEPLPRLVSSIVSSLLRKEVARCTHGAQVRDYLHVQDVADAFIALLESEVTGPVNIGSGDPVELREIATYVAHRLGADDLLRLGALPTPAFDPPFVVADVTRLTHDVGWKPRYDLRSGLNETIAWWSGRLNRVEAV
jgi:nucleoside-diphosphate-sugar epimerase